MQVHVPDPQLRDSLASEQKLSQRFGKPQAKLLMRRISEMFASARLGDFCSLPHSRVRHLDGRREGQIALNLLPSLEVVIAPTEDPAPEPQNGAPNWVAATHINILDVTELPTPDV